MIKKRRKMKKQPNKFLDPWDWDLEIGDRTVDSDGVVWDFYESASLRKWCLCEPTRRMAQCQLYGAKAVKVGEIWYWERNYPL